MGTHPSLFAIFLLIGFQSLEKGLCLALLYFVLPHFALSWKPVLFSNRKWRESGSGDEGWCGELGGVEGGKAALDMCSTREEFI